MVIVKYLFGLSIIFQSALLSAQFASPMILRPTHLLGLQNTLTSKKILSSDQSHIEWLQHGYIIGTRQQFIQLIVENKFEKAHALITLDIITEPIVRLVISKGASDVLKSLCDAGLVYNAPLMLKALVYAANNEQNECVVILYNTLLDYYTEEARQHALVAFIHALQSKNYALIRSLIHLFIENRPGLTISRFKDWGACIVGNSFPELHGSTPLRTAIQRNHIATVTYLLKHGAQLGITSESEIEGARRLQYCRLVELMTSFERERTLIKVEATAPPHAEADIKSISVFALIDRLQEGKAVREELYKRLLIAPPLASLYITDRDGNTLLHRAVQLRDTALFNRIITMNNELIVARNKVGEMPIKSASRTKNAPFLETLLTR